MDSGHGLGTKSGWLPSLRYREITASLPGGLNRPRMLASCTGPTVDWMRANCVVGPG